MRKYLVEGLREHDLKDLVIPMVSIDEFESKIDDDAIVVGFFVKDSDPANDLNRFIQKSPIQLLDTDVSPAPNEDGYFLVFVELSRDNSFYTKLKTILDEIKNLVDIDPNDWTFTCYGHNGVFDLTDKKIKVLIRTESIEDLKQKAFDDELLEFFQPSILDDLQLNEGTLTLTKGKISVDKDIIAFGSSDSVLEEIQNKPISLSENSQRTCKTLESILGEGWSVQEIDNIHVLTNAFSSNVLLLKT